MPTVALPVTSGWTKAADGPNHVYIPAIENFSWAITTGAAPGVSPSICPLRERGEDLSMQLVAGESLYVISGTPFGTSVTTGA